MDTRLPAGWRLIVDLLVPIIQVAIIGRFWQQQQQQQRTF